MWFPTMWHFDKCRLKTSLSSPLLSFRGSKWCLVSSLTLLEYSSDKQWHWSDCVSAQAGLSLCWLHMYTTLLEISCRGSYILNPYMPSVNFMGHRQTVQTQIRNHRIWCLIRIFTICLQKVLWANLEKEKIPPKTLNVLASPFGLNGLRNLFQR